MQQLLQVTVNPIKYELEIEHARLEHKGEYQPRADVRTTPSELNIKVHKGTMNIDTYEARKSLGFASARDKVLQAAQKGREHIAQLTRQYVETGAQMAKIEDGVNIGQIIRQKMQEQPMLVTNFLPSAQADLNYEPANIDMKFTPTEVDYQWREMRNVMNYVPGSIRMKILQYPSVDIKYVGGPIYIPKSADPNYVEEE